MARDTKGVIYGDESWGRAGLGNVRIRRKQLLVLLCWMSYRVHTELSATHHLRASSIAVKTQNACHVGIKAFPQQPL